MRRSPTPRRGLLLGLSATVLTLSACAAAAQNARTTPKADKADKKTEARAGARGEGRPDRDVRVYRYGGDWDGDRAVLGLTPASSAGKRDTLGVMVQSLASGGPAEKAGIEEGDRIASIN